MRKEKSTGQKVFDSVNVNRGKKIYYGSVSSIIKYLFFFICFFMILRFINNDITIEGTLERLSHSNVLSSVKISVKAAKILGAPLIPTTDVPGLKQLVNGLNAVLNSINQSFQAVTGIFMLLFSSVNFILNIIKYLVLGL